MAKNTGLQTVEKRRIMRAFKMDEISAVDRPAQQGARALIMKRYEEPSDISTEIKKKGVDYVDILSEVEAGHQHGIQIGRGEDGVSLIVSYAGMDNDTRHDHQVVREGEMWVMSTNMGHTHELDQAAMNNAVTAFVTKGENADPDDNTAKNAGSAGMVNEEEEPEMTEKNQAELDALTKRAERAEAIAAMPADVRKHFDGLPVEAQDAFIAKSEDERAEIVKAAAEANAVVYTATDGTEYTKSDDPRLVKMAKDRDADRKELAKSAAAAKDLEIENIAKSLTHLPGDLDARKALVKSVQSIEDEAQRTRAMDALKAQDAALGQAFKSAGTTGAAAPVSDAETQLNELAKAEMEANGGTFAKAYDTVLKTEQGRELYAQTLN